MTVTYQTGSFSAGADTNTAAIPVNNKGAMQVSWAGLDAFNSTMILQASNDAADWCDLGGAEGGIVIDDSPQTQVWEVTNITYNYIRISYVRNSVTAGTFTWYWEGD